MPDTFDLYRFCPVGGELLKPSDGSGFLVGTCPEGHGAFLMTWTGYRNVIVWDSSWVPTW